MRVIRSAIFISLIASMMYVPAHAYRCIFSDTLRDTSGKVVDNATVHIYFAGTTNYAKAYQTSSDMIAVNSVSSSPDGSFQFYIDRFDHSADKKFKIVATKGTTTITYDNVSIDRAVYGTYTINSDKTVTADLTIPKGVVYSVAPGKTLTFSGDFNAGRYQVFVGSGSVVFGKAREVYPQWWGTLDHRAVNSAIHSIKNIGGKIIFTESINFTAPINATNINTGIIFEGLGGNINPTSFYGPLLTAVNAEGLFDCTGSRELQFRNLRIAGDIKVVPKYGFLLARNSKGGGAGNHRFYNIITDYGSKFSVAPLYQYGSEENNYYGCTWVNNHAGGKVFVNTNNNIFKVASIYQTIYSGSSSSTVTNIFGGSLYNLGNTGQEDLYYLDETSDFHVYGQFWYNKNGRSYVYVDTKNQGSHFVSFDGIRGEPGKTAPAYGIYFGDAARTCVGFSFTNSHITAKTKVVKAHDNVTLQQFYYKNIYDLTQKGIACRNIAYSDITSEGSYIDVTGTATGCLFRGFSSRFDIATNVRTTIVDLNTGLFNNQVGLLGTTNVSLAVNADTTIYTVPASKACVLSHAILLAGADAGATSTISIGAKGSPTDFIPANTLSNLDAKGDTVMLMPVPSTTPSKMKSYVAGTAIQARVTNKSGGPTNTLYLFGFCY